MRGALSPRGQKLGLRRTRLCSYVSVPSSLF